MIALDQSVSAPHLTARDPATMDGVALVGTHTFAILIPGREEPDTMNILQLIFYIAALVCLVLAAFGVGGRISVGWAGMACWLIAAVFVPMLA